MKQAFQKGLFFDGRTTEKRKGSFGILANIFRRGNEEVAVSRDSLSKPHLHRLSERALSD